MDQSTLLGKHGAHEGNYLEPLSTNELLEKLEEWERYLEADPEVAYRLRTLNEGVVEDDTSKKCDDEQSPSKGNPLPIMRGPKP